MLANTLFENGQPEFISIQPPLAERIDTVNFTDHARMLVLEEQEIPVVVGIDKSLRPKIIDRCGMSCTFCHNEGTPVAAGHLSLNVINDRYLGGRVSVFEEKNGVDFLPGMMLPGHKFERAIGGVQAALGSSELHLTGGEPSLHPHLADIVRTGTIMGYEVGMTSNGENGERVLPECAEAGLKKVNFSIFGTNASELAAVQHTRFQSLSLAEKKIRSLDRSIRMALASDVKVSANIVMSDPSHSERVKRVIDQYAGAGVSVRILDDLDKGDVSNQAIYEMLAEIHAEPKELYVEAGSSNSRVRYVLPGGESIFFKQIRRAILPAICSGCTKNNDQDCKEGYYGVRLYVDQEENYKVGVCLQRMDLTVALDDFVTGSLSREIVDFRNNEYNALTHYYRERLDGDKR